MGGGQTRSVVISLAAAGKSSLLSGAAEDKTEMAGHMIFMMKQAATELTGVEIYASRPTFNETVSLHLL